MIRCDIVYLALHCTVFTPQKALLEAPGVKTIHIIKLIRVGLMSASTKAN